MAKTDSIIGLDIGGTKMAVILGDFTGRVIQRRQFDTDPAKGFEGAFETLCRESELLIDSTVRPGSGPCCISVSIGGPLDLDKGLILSPPNLPGWDNVPLKKMLAHRFGLPVHIEHDGNAGALAEWRFGAGQGARNLVFLTMGTGFGAGLILDGRLYRGSSFLAGEVGHIRLAKRGPEAYGKTGSWEAFCSGAGMARLASMRFPDRWKPGSITAKDLVDLAEQRDPDADAVIEEAGRYLGQGMAVLLDLLNPEVIVLGSLAIRLGDKILKSARAEMEKEALPAAVQACRIVPAALGSSLGDVAALSAAIAAKK